MYLRRAFYYRFSVSFVVKYAVPTFTSESLPFIVMFAHPDPTGDDPAAVLSSPARSREPAWSESCAGGHFGGAPAPPCLRPCALFSLLWFALSSDSCFRFSPNQFRHKVLLCFPGSFPFFVPLGLEVKQMNLVTEANVPRLGHFSCPSHCLSFANLFVACWPPWPGLHPAGEYLLGSGRRKLSF